MPCASLGVAESFSIFVFRQFSSNFLNYPGRIAAGGDVTLLFQSVSAGLPVSTTRSDLVIGGDYNITGGLNNGNTVVSPTSTQIQYSMNNVNGVTPQPIVDIPIDFAAEEAYLQCLSTGWAGLTPNVIAERVPFTDLLIINCTDPVLNIVTFNGNDIFGDGTNITLASLPSIDLNYPVGSTVLLNVLGDGPGVGFGNMTIAINGQRPPSNPSTASTVLWNYPNTTLWVNGNGIYSGTIFAPFADGRANGNASLYGQFITGSYDGNDTSGGFSGGAINTANPPVLFNGCLPEVPACGIASLTLTKLANGATTFTGTPGTPFTYSVLVSNNTAFRINNIEVDDTTLGIDHTIPFLDPGESFPFIVDSVVQSGKAGTTYSNTVTATSNEAPAVSAVVTITIAALPVNVHFSKTPGQTNAMPGDIISYEFSLANMGNTDLTDVQLIDPTIGLNLSLPSFFSGVLALTTFALPAHATPGSTFTNTARLTASNLPAPGFLESSANVSITSPPTANFRKLSNVSAAQPGDTVLYSFIIQNESSTPLQSLTLNDPSLNLVRTIEVINANSTVVLQGPFTLPANAVAGSTIINTASLTGAFGTLNSSAAVTVQPLLSLLVTKDEDTAFATPGSTINYTLRVLNEGNVALTNVQINDSLAGFATVIPSLPAGQSQDFHTSVVVPLTAPIGSFVVNVVTAQADGVALVSARVGAVVISSPTPPVPPIPPALPVVTIAGSVSRDSARPGETVTFTGVVTNISAVTARNLLLHSPFFHYSSIIEVLAPGEALTLNANFIVPAGTPAGTIFTATLTAQSIVVPEQETSASFVVLEQAGVTLNNTVNESAVVQGDVVIYTITAVNTGNVPVYDIIFADPALNQELLVHTLSAGTVARTFLRKAVTEEPGTTFCNETTITAAAIGTVTATSCYTVFGLLLRKQANVSVVTVGNDVQYTVTIRNPMNITASGIQFRDLIPANSTLVAGSVRIDGHALPDSLLTTGIGIPPLGPNASTTIMFSLTAVNEPDGGSLSNTAEAAFQFFTETGVLSGTSFSNTVSVAVEEHEE